MQRIVQGPAASASPAPLHGRSSLTLARAVSTSAPMATAPPDLGDLSFEDALRRLEAIVQRLETGDESLDEAIRLYGEGDRLRRQCEDRLKAAQARIESIVAGGDGRPQGTRPFDAD